MYYCFAVTLATVLLIELTSITGVEGFMVTVNPTYIQVPKSGSHEVTLVCIAEPKQAITGCQIRIWYVGKREEGVLLDVPGRKGWKIDTVPNPYNNVTNYTAKLSGDNFNDGICYVKLHEVKGDHLLLGCKLTNKENQSAIDTTAIFLHDGSPWPLKTNKESLFVKRGASVDLKLLPEYGYVLRNCSSSLSNGDKVVNYRYIKQNQQIHVVTFPIGSPASPRYTALKELNQGECGFTINNVTDKDNGVFFVVYSAFNWDATHQHYYWYVGAKAVILIVPSMNMTISKSTQEISDGEEKTVTCTARGVDYADTRWSWWLDETDITYQAVKIRQGQRGDGWSWPWEAGVSQTVIFTFRQEDHGKKLICRLVNVKNSKWNLQREKQISIKQMTQSGKPTQGDTTTTQKTVTKSTSSNPKGSTESPSIPPTNSSSESPPTMPSTAESVTSRMSSDATHHLEGIDMPSNIPVIIGTVTGALLLVVIIGILVAFFKKLACFKAERDTDSLVQYNANSSEGQDTAMTPNRPSPKPKPRTQIAPTADRPTPKARQPKNSEPKKPKPSPQEEQLLRNQKPNPVAAQSAGAAGDDKVLYAELSNVKMTPVAPQAPRPEEVAYLQLNWDK